MRSFSTIVLLGCSLGSLVFGACSATTTTDGSSSDSAASTIDSADSTSAEGNMMMAAVDGSDQTQSQLTAAAVTLNVAANIGARFTPANCVTVTPSATAIKAVYNNCTGVHGLTRVTGELDLTISLSQQGQVAVHGTSSDLKVNGATLDIDATATYSVQGTSHELTVSTDGTGTGPLGNTVDHEGNYTLSWDTGSQCHSIMGDWSTELGSKTRSNTVDLSSCAGGCPTGSIVHTFPGGKTLTVTFDGTATASWTIQGGASAGTGAGSGSASAQTSGTVTLSCQ